MKIIIAGSRTIFDNEYDNKFNNLEPDHYYQQICKAIEASGWSPSIIVSGTARGVDQLGEKWAEENYIPIERHPAKWDMYGKAAGYIRNQEMALCSEALIAIMLKDNPTRGTTHMINLAKHNDLKIFIYEIE